MKVFISSEQLKELCWQFYKKVILKQKTYDILILVTKWALIPWYYIADMLWIKDIRTICLSSYVDNEQAILQEHYFPEIPAKKNVLIFDELTDTWDTLTFIKDRLKRHTNIDYWTLFKFKQSNFTPDIYIKEKWDEWIDFYYEN